MKHLFRTIYICLCLLTTVSCNFLDKFPDSSADIAIDTPEKISDLLIGAYPRISYFRFLETRTDNVGDRGNALQASRLNEAMYFWLDYDEENIDTPLAYWLECYRGIAQANQALEALIKFPDKNNPRIQALYAEAFLLRAYLHFMVANIWAEPYPGEEDAPNIQGIPYVERPEKNAVVKYHRGTLQETYEKIESDLRYGLSLINDEFFSIPKYRFNKKAAYAFATRFFAYTGKWQEVIDYASYVLKSRPEILLKTGEELVNLSDIGRIQLYADKTHPSNLLITNTESLWATNVKEDRYGLNYRLGEQIFDRVGAKTLGSIQGYSKAKRTTADYAVYIPKFSQFLSEEGLLNSERGRYTYNVLFTTEEVLLNRIEAYAMTEKYDLAFNDLMTFYMSKHRINNTGGEPNRHDLELIAESDRNKIQPFYRPLKAQQSSLLFVVAEIRRQEFIHEGLRWFDLRRFNMSIDRNLPGEVRQPALILQPEDNRKTLQIPEAALVFDIPENKR